MRARVRDVDDATLERAAQLTQKTNQFNLTLVRRTRRGRAQARRATGVDLQDARARGPVRPARHRRAGDRRSGADEPATLLIDTLLLSCRVIGRTAEAHLLAHVSRAALERAVSALRGFYVPGPRNALVADLYPRLGFTPVPGRDGVWDYDLAANGPLQSDYIDDLP